MAAAKSIALGTGAPLIGVNHLEGHILANAVEHGPELTPAVCLVVSGGHTMLVHMPEPLRYELLGQTVDDAAGEAFDKIARFLGLGFPGGPALDRLARDGDPNAIRFPRAMADSGDFDFSLSGLKTAVLRHVKAERQAGRDVDPADLAASFQEAIVDVQVAKTIDAARDRGVDTVLLGGGVVANTRLRERMEKAGAEAGFRVLFPSMDLCTDNGAMIAVAGTWRLLRGERTSLGVGADPRWSSDDHVPGHGGSRVHRLAPVRSPPGRGPPRGRGRRSVDREIANLTEARGYGNEFTFFNMDVRAEGSCRCSSGTVPRS
jgi:N6-L-threonylcarbamoyladenine synthase